MNQPGELIVFVADVNNRDSSGWVLAYGRRAGTGWEAVQLGQQVELRDAEGEHCIGTIRARAGDCFRIEPDFSTWTACDEGNPSG